ncbi:competence type IV pilus minor pilin ComGF [Staphylococcus argenteus]|uniref:competence type IV pilus minor pilin ComGF n=2 Tax=Staphylococcus argenteus TaxID=985002 RepID=UPI000931EBB9|nr:competence type IV pilus minor pilin ComGF [Staphylococcus argenteus]MBE2124020.1 prepilin-type N-terminal cleavage/methylation domain-containing protein [Staphylococcus argenteus]MBE2131774.1 prepilin-type N-terminal cleavage/methylation domain-containing protein [Staphylococcus argenteus]MBE2140306.1 prepilin-type N-terminal cleavage/methylation domain-containing protein [Staphylococcus argenteus]MCG9805269.1 prepilin-type N-terminal cleavage/methylation domain-containing protein [Staphylo
MLLSWMISKFVQLQMKILQNLKNVFNIKVKAFSLIEMILAMMAISIILLIVPDTIKISKTFLNESKDLTSVDFEFFARDLIDDFKKIDKKQIEIKPHNILINKTNEQIEYKFLNNKIIKTVNDKGNITMLNNVLSFSINKDQNATLRISISLKEGELIRKKILFV